MRKSYPSDITREQFGIIRGDPEKAKKKTCPQTYDLYDIFVHCCICWKRAAHGEGFSMTSRTGKLCVTTTYSSNRTRTASACLIKSCKNWSRQKEKSIRDADTAREKGYDAGKTSGIKLHIEVYAMGLLTQFIWQPLIVQTEAAQ